MGPGGPMGGPGMGPSPMGGPGQPGPHGMSMQAQGMMMQSRGGQIQGQSIRKMFQSNLIII